MVEEAVAEAEVEGEAQQNSLRRLCPDPRSGCSAVLRVQIAWYRHGLPGTGGGIRQAQTSVILHHVRARLGSFANSIMDVVWVVGFD